MKGDDLYNSFKSSKSFLFKVKTNSWAKSALILLAYQFRHKMTKFNPHISYSTNAALTVSLFIFENFGKKINANTLKKREKMKHAKCLMNSTERAAEFVCDNENIYSDLAHGATTQHVDRVLWSQLNWLK